MFILKICSFSSSSLFVCYGEGMTLFRSNETWQGLKSLRVIGIRLILLSYRILNVKCTGQLLSNKV